MAELAFTFPKAQTNAFRDFLQQRRLIATVLPADVENFVGHFVCFLACLRWVEENVAAFGPGRKRGRVLLNQGVDKHIASAQEVNSAKLIRQTSSESIFNVRLITTDTLFYITQSLLSAFYDIFITDR